MEGAPINYYERHLGDYARDTGHLSMLEHGAYGLLLDRYYATEAPIPDAQVYRIARASSKQERAAVDAVLAEFFHLVDGAWVNRRAAAEIERYQAAEPERSAKRDGNADRVRRHRERRAALFQALRDAGHVARYDTSTAELETLMQRVTGELVTHYDTASTHHTPVTSQELGGTEAHTTAALQRDPVCVETPPAAVQAAIELRKRGIRCTPQNPDLIAAVAEGVAVSAICAMADSYPDKPAGYVIAAARREHAAAAHPITEQRPHANRNPGRKLSAVEQVEAAIRDRRAREANDEPPAAA